MPPRFVTRDEAVALHAEAMIATGYAPASLRDPGALESALHRPVTAYHYADKDSARLATALAIGISQAQAFVDGNKRTAFLALDTFLRWNGLHYAGDPLDLAQNLERFAERTTSFADAEEAFAEWLRPLISPLDDEPDERTSG